jgi:Ca2+-binding EF-hand superfamily protein
MIILSKAPINQKVKFAFVLFDSNKSGDLSKNELVAMLTNVLTGLFAGAGEPALPSDDIEQISNAAFTEADAIQDGRIT